METTTAPAPTHSVVSLKLPVEVKSKLEQLAAYEQRNLGAQTTFLFNNFIIPELDALLEKYLPRN